MCCHNYIFVIVVRIKKWKGYLWYKLTLKISRQTRIFNFSMILLHYRSIIRLLVYVCKYYVYCIVHQLRILTVWLMRSFPSFLSNKCSSLWSMAARAKKWVTYLNGGWKPKATGGSCTCIYYIGSHLKWHKSFHTWDYFPESKGWCQLSHISSPVWKWHLPGKKFLLFWLQSTAQKSIYCNLINIT